MSWSEPRFIDVRGVRTAIYEAGQGPVVLLVHGCSLCVDAQLTWFRLWPQLSRRHRVIAFDQPGFGLSAMPATGALPDRLARTAHARDLLIELGIESCAAIGHSEGGFIATRLALDEPSRIRTLIVCASGAVAPDLGGEADAHWRAAAARAYDYVGRSLDEDRLIATEERLQLRPDHEFETRMRANYRRDLQTGHVEMFRSRARALGDYTNYASLQVRELYPLFPRLTAPTLLLWGGSDATVPIARGEALAERMPGATLRVLEGAGHWVMHDAASAFGAAVRAHLSVPRGLRREDGRCA